MYIVYNHMVWSPISAHVFILFFAGLLSAMVTIICWQRKNSPESRELAVLMAAIAEWTLAEAIEAAVVPEGSKIFWSQVSYLGLVNVPALLLIFSLDYTQQFRWTSWQMMAALWAIPVITLILAWTNAWHGLVWSGFEPGTAPNTLTYRYGAWYWIFFIYTYLCVFVSDLILLRQFFRSARPYRLQTGAMVVAGLFPVAAGALYGFNWGPLPGFDWTPIGFVGAGMVLAWGLFHSQLFDLVQVARETLMEQLVDGVIVLDANDRLLDINLAARKLMGDQAEIWIGQPAQNLFDSQTNLAIQRAVKTPIELVLGKDPPHVVELQISNLYTRPEGLAGRLVQMRDITARKQAEQAQQAADQRVQAQLEEINSLQEKMHEQATRDDLTGLHNQRYLQETLGRELSRARRENLIVSLIMLDIDHFRAVNDAFGRAVGDQILEGLGILIRNNIRLEDIACRFGGEEFILVLPGMSAENAARKAEELCRCFANLCHGRLGPDQPASLSAGVAVFPVHGGNTEALLLAADQALHQAKSQGQNQIVVKALPAPEQGIKGE